MTSNTDTSSEKPRRRSLTSVTLQWLAEKCQRAERIKEALKNGTYQVDSQKIAQALINSESSPK